MIRRRQTPATSAAARAARARRQRAREELALSRRHLALAVVFGVLAFAVLGVSSWLLSMKAAAHPGSNRITGDLRTVVMWCSAAGFLLLGVLATRRSASGLGHFVAARSGAAVAPAVRLVASAVGYVIIFFGTLGILDVPVEHLLVGAGLAGVVLGIAGQQTLGNLFAGMVLVTARPFTIGDYVRVRAGALGGIFEGTVMGMSLTYVTLSIEGVTTKIPNSGMLAAGVGRLPRRAGQTGPVPVVGATGAAPAVSGGTAAPAPSGATAPGTGTGTGNTVTGNTVTGNTVTGTGTGNTALSAAPVQGVTADATGPGPPAPGTGADEGDEVERPGDLPAEPARPPSRAGRVRRG